jgi:hypothetical protein
MLPLSPALFVAAANALLGPKADELPVALEPLGMPDPFTRDIHAPSDGWATAAFIAHVGHWSHGCGRSASSWPFPLSADCDALARLADYRRVLGAGIPDPGAIYLRWSEVESRFVRAGVVLYAVDLPGPNRSYDCLLVEGSAMLSRTEGAVTKQIVQTTVQWARRTRVQCCPFLGDRFISWVDLDGRNDTTQMGPAS